jgi:hypothetical protein
VDFVNYSESTCKLGPGTDVTSGKVWHLAIRPRSPHLLSETKPTMASMSTTGFDDVGEVNWLYRPTQGGVIGG